MLQVATNMNAMIGNWQVVLQINRELKKNSGGRRHRQGVKILRHNLCVFLSMYLLWLHCLFLFSLKFNCLQRVFLNEKIDDNCWNIDHVLQTTWKWNNWRLTREQDGTNVSFISSHIHVCFLSCVISLIVLPTLPSPSSTAFLKFPNTSKMAATHMLQRKRAVAVLVLTLFAEEEENKTKKEIGNNMWETGSLVVKKEVFTISWWKKLEVEDRAAYQDFFRMTRSSPTSTMFVYVLHARARAQLAGKIHLPITGAIQFKICCATSCRGSGNTSNKHKICCRK